MPKKKGISYLWRVKSANGQSIHVVEHEFKDVAKLAEKFFTKQDDEVRDVKHLGECYGDAGVFPAQDE